MDSLDITSDMDFFACIDDFFRKEEENGVYHCIGRDR